MKIVVTGAGGQLGRALARSAPDDAQAVALTSSDLDITDAQAMENVLRTLHPDALINTAAYTAVDRAESESAAAYRVNARAVADMASACERHGVRLVHLSTDYVFDGRGERPYRSQDRCAPVNVYGDSKLVGEQAALSLCPNALVIRTSRLYGRDGRNFLRSMLARLGESPEPLRIVADQIAAPTEVTGLARVLWQAVRRPFARGILHWTDDGAASWYEWAVAIRSEAIALGLLPARSASIEAIPSSQYVTPARRPAFSALDTAATVEVLGMTPVCWRENLRTVLEDLAHA